MADGSNNAGVTEGEIYRLAVDHVSPVLIPDAVESVIGFPDGKEFMYFGNFPEFKTAAEAFNARASRLLEKLCKAGKVPGDEESAEEWIEDVMDDVMARVDTALDAHVKAMKAATAGGTNASGRGMDVGAAAIVGSKNLGHQFGKKGQGGFANQAVARPQDLFPEKPDNSNTPWVPPGLDLTASSNAGSPPASRSRASHLEDHALTLEGKGIGPSRAVHPYLDELRSLQYPSWLTGGDVVVQPPRPLGDTPFTWVETEEQLAAMAATLEQAREFAVDLEHHSYRSFQGFTCLMQVSTRTEDWVVDTLALRGVLGKHLRQVFANASILKVLHGCNSDVVWLQRDFGLFLVGVFDTGQAARVLGLESFALAHLLHVYCGVKANKSFQLADWRVRPLPQKMMEYARDDTHYLLHIFDQLRVQLRDANQRRKGGESMIMEVLRRSRDICVQLYEKPLFTEASYLELYRKSGGRLSDVQLAVFAALFAWRDTKARAEDEGVQYILPNHVLFSLAKSLPSSLGGVRAVARGGSSGFALAAAEEILSVVSQARRRQQQAPPPARPVAAALDGRSGSSSPCAVADGDDEGTMVVEADAKVGMTVPLEGAQGEAGMRAARQSADGSSEGALRVGNPEHPGPDLNGAGARAKEAAAIARAKVRVGSGVALFGGPAATAAATAQPVTAATPAPATEAASAPPAICADALSDPPRKCPIVRKASSSLFGGAAHQRLVLAPGPSPVGAPHGEVIAAAASSVQATVRGASSNNDATTSSKLASIHSSFSLPFGPTAAAVCAFANAKGDAGDGTRDQSGANAPPECTPADEAGSADAPRAQEADERDADASSHYTAIVAGASDASPTGTKADAATWRKLRPPVPREASGAASAAPRVDRGSSQAPGISKLSGTNPALGAGSRKAMSQVYEMPGSKRRRGEVAAKASLLAQAAASAHSTREPHHPTDDGAAALHSCGLASDDEEEQEAASTHISSGSGSNGALAGTGGVPGGSGAGPSYVADADGNIGVDEAPGGDRRGAIDYAKRWASNPAVYEDRLRHGRGRRGRGGGDKPGAMHKAMKPVKETGLADGLKPGRRSQAFPVSGNRVGTFTK